MSFQKLTRKCDKISIKILKNMYKLFPTFLQIFFTISVKLRRNIFNVFFHKISKYKTTPMYPQNFPKINPTVTP